MSTDNDFRSIWLAMPSEKRYALAARLGTSYRYLQRMSGGFAFPSLRFAERMKALLPGLDLGGFSRAMQDAGKRMPR